VPYLTATEAMGTRFEVILETGSAIADRAIAEEALEEVTEGHRRWSCFTRDSIITRINEEGHQRPVAVDDVTFELLHLCQRLWRDTGGHFDAALGSRMASLGHHPGPAFDETPGFAAVELDHQHRRVRLLHPSVRLDLGAIAKGHALDLAAEVIVASGVDRALIHGGTSSVIAIGSPPGVEGWVVAIAATGVEVSLADEALAVSSSAGRRSAGGPGHVLEPTSGNAAAGGCHVVCGESAAISDAWATALVAAAGDLSLPRGYRQIALPIAVKC